MFQLADSLGVKCLLSHNFPNLYISNRLQQAADFRFRFQLFIFFKIEIIDMSCWVAVSVGTFCKVVLNAAGRSSIENLNINTPHSSVYILPVIVEGCFRK